jgi:hypothetical protein
MPRISIDRWRQHAAVIVLPAGRNAIQIDIVTEDRVFDNRSQRLNSNPDAVLSMALGPPRTWWSCIMYNVYTSF